MSDQANETRMEDFEEAGVVDPTERKHIAVHTAASAVPFNSSSDMLMDPASFDHAVRVAKVFASSMLVPQHLRGKVADCLLALAMARRLNEDPLIVMQAIYFVSGKAGWSASYMIGRANRSGIFSTRINWRIAGEGEGLRVTAFAKLADSGEEVSVEVSFAMAKSEGWTRSEKYKTMPTHMLKWRSATMLIRLYAPEIMLGLSTADELQDVAAASGHIQHESQPEVIVEQPTKMKAAQNGHSKLRDALGLQPEQVNDAGRNPFNE